MSEGIKITQADFDAAAKKVFNLQRELDITNADHIALWLEHSTPLEGNISWFACRIIEAHEIEMAKARMAIEKAATERELELSDALEHLMKVHARDGVKPQSHNAAEAKARRALAKGETT